MIKISERKSCYNCKIFETCKVFKECGKYTLWQPKEIETKCRDCSLLKYVGYNKYECEHWGGSRKITDHGTCNIFKQRGKKEINMKELETELNKEKVKEVVITRKEELKNKIKERNEMIQKLYKKRRDIIKEFTNLDDIFYRKQRNYTRIKTDFIKFVNFDRKYEKILKNIWYEDSIPVLEKKFRYKKEKHPYKNNETWNDIKHVLKELINQYEEYKLDQLTTELCEATDCYKALAGITKNCPKCGIEFPKGAKFCNQCGGSI